MQCSCSLQHQFPGAKSKITHLPSLDFNSQRQHSWLFLKHYLPLVSVNPLSLFSSYRPVAFPATVTGFSMTCKAPEVSFGLSLYFDPRWSDQMPRLEYVKYPVNAHNSPIHSQTSELQRHRDLHLSNLLACVTLYNGHPLPNTRLVFQFTEDAELFPLRASNAIVSVWHILSSLFMWLPSSHPSVSAEMSSPF